MTIEGAAKKAGITKAKVNSYIEKGYLLAHLGGFMIYYRDLLRASWVETDLQLKESGQSASRYKYKRKKK